MSDRARTISRLIHLAFAAGAVVLIALLITSPSARLPMRPAPAEVPVAGSASLTIEERAAGWVDPSDWTSTQTPTLALTDDGHPVEWERAWDANHNADRTDDLHVVGVK